MSDLSPHKKAKDWWLARMCLARIRQAFVPGIGGKLRLNLNSTTTSNQQQYHGDNMSFDQRPDQSLPEFATEEAPSMPATNGERITESADVYGAPLPPAPVDETSRAVDDVLYSDVGKDSDWSRQILRRLMQDQIGVNTLLSRLKQSIASARVRSLDSETLWHYSMLIRILRPS